MSADDDAAYRRSVRNMSAVLAVIVIVVFAAIYIPPYVNPAHDVFQTSVTAGSPFGFTMHLATNATALDPSGAVLITGWLNSTSDSLQNVTAAESWALQQDRLWTRPCTSGWPIGVGVMRGHYTADNYTLGALLPVPQPLTSCPAGGVTPTYFVFEAHSSKALVSLGGTPAIWSIETSFAFGQSLPGYGLQPGVYTAVLADEWGDVLTANFLVS